MKQQDLSFSFASDEVWRERMWVRSPKYFTDSLDHHFVAFWLQNQ